MPQKQPLLQESKLDKIGKIVVIKARLVLVFADLFGFFVFPCSRLKINNSGVI
ncbi:MAG: hypothetical protein PWR01_2994 [Clostridiales bacterium]|jgi:hypothetical protein|nr:hypothetical protein [Clostridiales bacterium]MDN5281921.1 hypothetical protein [Candidatus Ozemobacter sp.]